MFVLLAVICLSALSAGIFLQIKKKTMMPAIGAGLLIGVVAFLLGRNLLPFWVCFVLGMVCTALYMTVRERRSFLDGLLAVCIGGCQLGLCVTFLGGLRAVTEGTVVLFLYVLFYMLHIPAVLLTFDGFRLQRDWQANAKGLQRVFLPLIGVGMLVLITAVTFLPEESVFDAVVKILLTVSVFWLSLSVIVLLVFFGQKRERSQAQDYYLSNMNTFMNVVRAQRHDYNLHVQTVAGLIAQQKWDACRNYVNALVQDTKQMNDVLPVKDPAVAGLIHYYRILIEQNGHTLFLDIRNDMSEIVTDPYETNKILGNLLQNAFDEISQRKGLERIELGIFKRGEYCVIRVSNKVTDPTDFAVRKGEIFRQGFTTKQGHDGVGLSSIRALTKKAGGDVTVWLEEDIVHFIASIPIRLKLNTEGGSNENI